MSAIGERPRPYQEVLRHVNQGGERRLPITHGWYMRGHNLPGGAWEPEPGLPSDVLVYLDMGDTYVREMYPDKGFRALSVVAIKKATANLDPLFSIAPPNYDDLVDAIARLSVQRPAAVAAMEAEIAQIKEKIADGGLPAGEPAQLCRKKVGLEKRIGMMNDDANFDPWPIYEAMVHERQAVLESQQDPDAVRLAALEKEHKQWDEHLRDLRATRDSTSAPAISGKSTRRATESFEG